MTEPFVFTDEDGDRLEIRPDTAAITPKAHLVISGSAVVAYPESLPGIVAALYRAAGQPAPIVLTRVTWHGTDRTAYTFNGFRVEREARWIRLFGRTVDAATARGLARILAEMADDADAEPDPAKLERLTAFLDEQMDTTPEDLARRLLRGFELKERAA